MKTKAWAIVDEEGNIGWDGIAPRIYATRKGAEKAMFFVEFMNEHKAKKLRYAIIQVTIH